MSERRSVRVQRVGDEAAAQVHAVVRAAFSARPPLDPAADALAETEESIAAALAAGGGMVALAGTEVVGALVLDPVDDPHPAAPPRTLWVRRFGVLPAWQEHGVGAHMVAAVIDHAALAPIAVLARAELPRAQEFWQGHGFVEVARHEPYVELVRAPDVRREVADADAMRRLGADVAAQVRAGDLVVLSGGLGAGKTTFTQGLAEGLGVRGPITSPTFVIARVHPSLVAGPALVHVDAYRLGGIDELDDLDLDASLEEAVTVVEWGAGVAEQLADSRLEVSIERALGNDPDATGPAQEPLDPRVVRIRGSGPRWTS